MHHYCTSFPQTVNVPGGKERWWSVASDQPEEPQSACEIRTLQDVGPPYAPMHTSFSQRTGWPS